MASAVGPSPRFWMVFRKRASSAPASNESEYESNPRASPDCRERTMEDTKAAVWNPEAFSRSARVGTSGASAGDTLSRMPCSAG